MDKFTATTAVSSGNLGTFFLTNVRLVWHADAAESFNVSIPYMQAGSCLRRSAGSRDTDAPSCLTTDEVHVDPRLQIRRGARGRGYEAARGALKLRYNPLPPSTPWDLSRCGGYVLGFRMDPAEHMKTVFKELSSMHAIYSREPIFIIKSLEEANRMSRRFVFLFLRVAGGMLVPKERRTRLKNSNVNSNK